MGIALINSISRDDDENNSNDDDDSAEPRDMPVERVPIPFGAIPQQYPLTHMPQQQLPSQHMMPPQQQLPPQIPFVVSYISQLFIIIGQQNISLIKYFSCFFRSDKS